MSTLEPKTYRIDGRYSVTFHGDLSTERATIEWVPKKPKKLTYKQRQALKSAKAIYRDWVAPYLDEAQP